MFVLGLTGSIGKGKSTTAQLFAEMGVPVYDADATVHRLYEREAVAAIEQVFPGTTEANGVDRENLSVHVVGNAPAMMRLVAGVHPMLRAHERDFLAMAEAAGAPVAGLDIPLLFETKGETRVDAVLVVSAPENVQLQRILSRPNMTAAKLETILVRQMSAADKRQRADFVVDTSKGLDSAREQIRHVLAKVATMPQRRS